MVYIQSMVVGHQLAWLVFDAIVCVPERVKGAKRA